MVRALKASPRDIDQFQLLTTAGLVNSLFIPTEMSILVSYNDTGHMPAPIRTVT